MHLLFAGAQYTFITGWLQLIVFDNTVYLLSYLNVCFIHLKLAFKGFAHKAFTTQYPIIVNQYLKIVFLWIFLEIQVILSPIFIVINTKWVCLHNIKKY